jgi:hypothetical protein
MAGKKNTKGSVTGNSGSNPKWAPYTEILMVLDD